MKPLARIHLDPLGGIAGDMFVAAMADAFPELVEGLMAELRKLPLEGEGRGEGISFEKHADASLRGLRFVVATVPRQHPHTPYAEIRRRLAGAGLEPQVLRHALGLFELLAHAEAEVHGIAVDEVEFHELGAWDSIVDFVAAAYFIATLAPESWTLAALPLGGGRVNTAHGVLPVPAPATAMLLRGLEVIDDGIPGERVTPTGAAIAKYLRRTETRDGPGIRPPGRNVNSRSVPGFSLSPVSVGQGFGSRRLPGIPNMLRVLAFEHALAGTPAGEDEIAVLQFEIDDQSAEDLAVALERIRATPGVLEAFQLAAYGKKGRLATQVQVLVTLPEVDRVADACLAQTTTLGLRIARVQRRTLMRAPMEVAVPDAVRVKVATRPAGNLTAKAEMDDVARLAHGRKDREDLRERAEHEALKQAHERDRHED